MWDILLIVLGIILLIIGLAGCVLPVLPGPPLSYAALLLLHFTKAHQFTEETLILWAVVAIGVTVIDNLIPIWGAKKYGGSRKAIWGSLLGLLVGLFAFPPIGILIGPFLGAFIGELIEGKDTAAALRSGFGTFVGLMGGMILKLMCSGLITYVFFRELI